MGRDCIGNILVDKLRVLFPLEQPRSEDMNQNRTLMYSPSLFDVAGSLNTSELRLNSCVDRTGLYLVRLSAPTL